MEAQVLTSVSAGELRSVALARGTAPRPPSIISWSKRSTPSSDGAKGVEGMRQPHLTQVTSIEARALTWCDSIIVGGARQAGVSVVKRSSGRGASYNNGYTQPGVGDRHRTGGHSPPSVDEGNVPRCLLPVSRHCVGVVHPHQHGGDPIREDRVGCDTVEALGGVQGSPSRFIAEGSQGKQLSCQQHSYSHYSYPSRSSCRASSVGEREGRSPLPSPTFNNTMANLNTTNNMNTSTTTIIMNTMANLIITTATPTTVLATPTTATTSTSDDASDNDDLRI